MSIRTDSGVCRYCGVVMQVAKMSKVDGATGFDAYACPECGSEVPKKSSGRLRP